MSLASRTMASADTPRFETLGPRETLMFFASTYYAASVVGCDQARVRRARLLAKRSRAVKALISPAMKPESLNPKTARLRFAQAVPRYEPKSSGGLSPRFRRVGNVECNFWTGDTALDRVCGRTYPPL